jgi:7-carboxy-7-deazaguanine synthase
MAKETLTVSEIFGPTFQGEGPSTGRRTAFVRLGHCNLHCVWCDADYTWAYSSNLPNLGYTDKVYDPREELREWRLSEIVSAVEQMNVPMVVITGGEPLLQAKSLGPLVQTLKGMGKRVEFETNGTLTPAAIQPWWSVDQWNISPKLANSANSLEERYKPEVWKWFMSRVPEKCVFKFVVSTDADLTEIEVLVKRNEIPSSNIWVMPEGCSPTVIGKRLADVAQRVLDLGWNMTSRLQVEIWNDKRGV